MEKVILITGASSGFGKATAELLSEKGNIVYGACRRKMEDEKIHYIQLDVSKPETIEPAVEAIVAKEGRIDVLINNAGYWDRRRGP